MPGNANAKQFLRNVTPSTYLRYADHTDRAILPIGVKGRRKDKRRQQTEDKKNRFLELPRPTAGS